MCPRDNDWEKTVGPDEEAGPLVAGLTAGPGVCVWARQMFCVRRREFGVYETILISGFVQP